VLELLFSLLLRFCERLGLLPADREVPNRPQNLKGRR
jgi:hypothetical protein